MNHHQASTDPLKGWISPWEEAAHQREQAKQAEAAALAASWQAAQRDNSARPVDPDEPERSLGELARRRAELMLERIGELCEPVTVNWLRAQSKALEGGALKSIDPESEVSEADQLAALVRRVCCPKWWRRSLRKVAGRKREAAAARLGKIGKGRALYVTNDSAQRHQRQQAKSRAMLEATEIETEDGERITLAQAADASTANPSIRRGEFMTRIKGCEEWAKANRLVGEFATLTAPSRFHPTGKQGLNHRYTGGESHPGAGNYGPVQPNDPKAAQGWLCAQWARARAELARLGLRIFGFRIAEPHADSCPHWHAIWWADPAEAEAIREVVAAYWLADHPHEYGNKPSIRAKFERIQESKGGALAYLSKYIAKNIDDAGAVGAEGHDEASPKDKARAEGAKLVRAWASLHGIRQFQALGQPPVTAWRELRRLDAAAIEAESVGSVIALAHDAVNRHGERRACWRGYLFAQGGAMLPRKEYRVRVAVESEVRQGIYGPTVAARPLGLITADSKTLYRTHRKEWRPRGTWEGSRFAGLVEAWGATASAPHVLFEGVKPPPDAAPTSAEFIEWDLRHGRAWRRLPEWQRAALASPKGEEARPQAAQPWTRVNNCTRTSRVHPDQTRPLGALPGQIKRRPAPGGQPDTLKAGPGGRINRQKDPPTWKTSPSTPPT